MNAIDTLITLADVRGSLDLRCQFQGDWANAEGGMKTRWPSWLSGCKRFPTSPMS